MRQSLVKFLCVPVIVFSVTNYTHAISIGSVTNVVYSYVGWLVSTIATGGTSAIVLTNEHLSDEAKISIIAAGTAFPSIVYAGKRIYHKYQTNAENANPEGTDQFPDIIINGATTVETRSYSGDANTDENPQTSVIEGANDNRENPEKMDIFNVD